MDILIAEDELLERKAMKKFIKDNFNDFQVVGEAVNGRMAIRLAEELQPDIIFMDIKMPGINGLEAIEHIYALQPHIKFILVSAYDTFEYAKQAMRFGIKDYILKPGKTEEIVKALLRVQKEIMAERDLATEKERSTQLLRENLVRKVIKHPIHEDVPRILKELYPMMASCYFLVFSADTEIRVKEMNQVLEKHIDASFILYETEEVVIALILLTQEVKKSEQLLLARKLSIEVGEDVFIGIGASCTSFHLLPESYQQAYTACFQLKGNQKSKYSFLQADVENYSEWIIQIVEAVKSGKQDDALRIFRENEWQCKDVDKEKMYISIQNILTKRYISDVHHSLSSLQTSKDWQTYLNICCMKMNEYYQSKQLMTQARAYIEEKYSKPITLEDVSNGVNLSPNYFSNLFKEEFGETFIELLTRIRMEKAREFIEGNIHSLKEISYMVGYKDPNYFSRVFKRYYHHSPKQFQKIIFKK